MMAQENDPYKQQQQPRWMPPTETIYTNGNAHSFHIPSPALSSPSALPSPIPPQQHPTAFASPVPDHNVPHILNFHYQSLPPILHQPPPLPPPPNMLPPQYSPTQMVPLPPPQPPIAMPPQQPLNFPHDVICNHLYQVGFVHGLYSDLTLHIPTFESRPIFNLHSLVLSRSPFLAQYINANLLERHEITLNVKDPNVTETAFGIALGHLYAGWSQTLLTSENARSVLAAAFLLGLEDLCVRATECVKNDISRHTVVNYAAFVEDDRFGYGPYSTEIRDACHDFLTRVLSKDLDAFPATTPISFITPDKEAGENETVPNGHVTPTTQPGSTAQTTSAPAPTPSPSGTLAASDADPQAGYRELVNVFAQLPFDWFKRCTESPRLAVPSDMARYQFAKECVAVRERLRRAQGVGSDVVGGEESVVLAFGGRGGSQGGRLTVVRKSLKGQQNGVRTKTLWKVPMQ